MTVLEECPVVSTDQPREWSFISNVTSELLTDVCPEWCELDHSRDMETPTHPHDVWHQKHSDSVCLPVNDSGDPEEVPVLSWAINVRPFDKNMAPRLPFASVEIMQDAWIEDLDPDAFEAVIETLEGRVAAMREAHAQLLRARAAYRVGL